MADLNTTRTFVDGDSVNAAAMNNIIDQAVIQNAFISGKTPIEPGVPLATDYLVYSETASSTLKKVKYGTKVSSVALTMPAPFTVGGSPVTGAGTLAVTLPAQSGNVFFCSPVLGVSGAPLFRRIVGQDVVQPPTAIAALSIDWRYGDNLYRVLSPGTFPFTFANPIEGQQINVMLSPNVTGTYTVTFPVDYWKGGVAPAMTPTFGHADIFHFYFQGGKYFGWADQNFF